MSTAKIELPPKLIPVFSKPLGGYRYRGAYGGRGSGKSFNFAKMAAVFGYAQPLRILCTREFQASIKESFHAELKAAIASEPWLEDAYDVGVDYLRGKNGTEFIFRGLRNSVNSIKSLAGIDITIVEEAEDVPEDSWLALEATVFRKDNSELWPVWNPCSKGSPVDKRFIQAPPENSAIVQMNWVDNPFFPKALNDLREREQKRLDPGVYGWIWEGEYLERSERQVFKNWRVEDFETPDDAEFMMGLDLGFSRDPNAFIRCFIDDEQKKLYIDYESGGVGIEIDHMPDMLLKIPGADNHVIRADSARPETISYLNRNGFTVRGAKKGKGSIEDGIAFLQSYDIIVHPRCREVQKELRLYSYKTNKAGDVLPKLQDSNNHCFVGETLVSTPTGRVMIKDISPGDYVLTRRGPRRVLKKFCNGIKEVKTYNLINGQSLTCTDTHDIITGQGKVRIRDLNKSHTVYYEDDTCKFIETENQRLPYLMARNIAAIQKAKGDLTECISKKAALVEKINICTNRYIFWKMEISPKDTIYTILMVTRLITLSTILLLLMAESTFLRIAKSITKITRKIRSVTLTALDTKQANGTGAKMAANGTCGTMKRTKRSFTNWKITRAIHAERYTLELKENKIDIFVQTNANQSGEETAGLTMLNKCAFCGSAFRKNKFAKTKTCSRSCANSLRHNGRGRA